MALGIPASLLVARIAQIPLTYPVAPQHKLPLLLPLYLVAPVAVEVYRRLETGAWSDYGIAWDPSFGGLMVVGFAIAAGGVVALIALQVGLGWRRWQALTQAPPVQPSVAQAQSPEALGSGTQTAGPSPGVVLLAVLPLALFVGWIEELVFRGVLVNGLGQVWPIWLMAIAVSLIFAVSHLVWDGPAGAPQLPGLAVMGAVLLLA
ncbi:hypothetical protein C8255_26915, partial [filamentous cyanobacterium CCP3]